MHKTSILKVTRFATMLTALALCVPLWSDVRSPTKPQRTCYCDCDGKSGKATCTHMCELPKYENRSWANSCHKKNDFEMPEPQSPRSDSSKDNGVQQARR
jgi:hypothetical protein